MCSQDIFVIRALNREIAYEKSITIGKSQEHSYLNAYGQIVVWKFIGLESLEELSTKVIRDGTAVWGHIFPSSDPNALELLRKAYPSFLMMKLKT